MPPLSVFCSLLDFYAISVFLTPVRVSSSSYVVNCTYRIVFEVLCCDGLSKNLDQLSPVSIDKGGEWLVPGVTTRPWCLDFSKHILISLRR